MNSLIFPDQTKTGFSRLLFISLLIKWSRAIKAEKY